MTDYATYWQPQSMDEAQYQIDTANAGDKFWQWGRDRAAELWPYMPRFCETVLDYGCGVGRVLTAMPAPYRIGIDVSAEMLAMAREHAPGCEFFLGDGRSIPLGDMTVDFCYSLLVLQHMDADDSVAVVRDTARVLRPGGRCYLLFSAFGDTRYAPGATVPRGPCHWKGQRLGSWHEAHNALAYTPEDVRAIAEDAGLDVLEIIVRDCDPKPGYIALWGQT